MGKKRSVERERLRVVAEELASEVLSGKWDELASLKSEPLIQNKVLLNELASRCPGRTDQEYEKAFSCAVRDNR